MHKPKAMMDTYLVNVLKHDAFDLVDLMLHLGQLAHFLSVFHTVLHLLFYFAPVSV
jgi:hypothetical protein